jgi:NAD(P)-dependent dehydrogenase (short-subunit alcohol dehydrogenase family)
MRLEDKTVLVTGGSTGIGRAIAVKCAREGAAVVIGDVRKEPKEGVYSTLDDDMPTADLIESEGGSASFVEADVADPDQCRTLVETAISTTDRLDVLVNNAGVHSDHAPTDLEGLPIEEWQRVLAINLSGQFYCAKYAIDELKRTEGTIINLGSVQSQEASNDPVYAASKAGTVNLTRDIAAAYGADNVTANAICPGPVRTPNWNYLPEEAIEAGREQTLLPRFGEPEDIANAVLFLASDDAEWITGEALYVDGGWTAH